MAAHTALARQMGVSEELLDALYHIDTHRHLFSTRELVALRYAEIVTTSGGDVDENLWDELQMHFDDDQLVELTTVIGLFNFFNRFADALQILPPGRNEKTGEDKARDV
jgi:alkylhydroperoxidase family enzyme